MNDIVEALDAADQKYPNVTVESSQDLKRTWSQELSSQLAILISSRLKGMPAFESAVHGERPVVRPRGGNKRTDVRVSDEINGPHLIISIKTTNFRDFQKKSRISDFNHNMSRFDDEFRSEAHEIHLRHPYCILIGLFFLPHESVIPRVKGNPSGFARWVNKLRERAGRDRTDSAHELFERIFVAPYVKQGDQRGAVAFFDVDKMPPLYGYPGDDDLLDLSKMLEEIQAIYNARNPVIANYGAPGSWKSGQLGELPSTFEFLVDYGEVSTISNVAGTVDHAPGEKN
ncbi:MAG: hypothetical protein U1E83_00200 [Methylotetracoccus sp.]